MSDDKSPAVSLASAKDSPPDGSEGPSLKRRSLASEYAEFLMENKKWWMIPIIVVVVVLGLAIMLLGGAGGAVAPFIYALF